MQKWTEKMQEINAAYARLSTENDDDDDDLDDSFGESMMREQMRAYFARLRNLRNAQRAEWERQRYVSQETQQRRRERDSQTAAERSAAVDRRNAEVTAKAAERARDRADQAQRRSRIAAEQQRDAAIKQKLQRAAAADAKARADVELAQRPPPPPSITVTGRTAKSLTIRWGLRAQDAWARGAEYAYTVHRADGPPTASAQNDYAVVHTGPGKQFKSTDLKPGTEYRFKVVATNVSGGSGPASDELTILTKTKPPAAPVLKDATNVTHNGMQINWNSDADAHGAKITEFLLEMESEYGYQQVYAGQDAHFVITGLAEAKTYRFRVRAKNATGIGPCSAGLGFSTRKPLPPPPPPTRILSKGISARALTIRWEGSDPGAAAGASATYRLEIGTTTDGSTEFVEVYAGVHSSFSATKLKPNTPYSGRVAGVNADGLTGAWAAFRFSTGSTGKGKRSKPTKQELKAMKQQRKHDDKTAAGNGVNGLIAVPPSSISANLPTATTTETPSCACTVSIPVVAGRAAEPTGTGRHAPTAQVPPPPPKKPTAAAPVGNRGHSAGGRAPQTKKNKLPSVSPVRSGNAEVPSARASTPANITNYPPSLNTPTKSTQPHGGAENVGQRKPPSGDVRGGTGTENAGRQRPGSVKKTPDRFGGSKKSASMKMSKRFERKEADKRQRAATATAPDPVVTVAVTVATVAVAVAVAEPPAVKAENPNFRGNRSREVKKGKSKRFPKGKGRGRNPNFRAEGGPELR